MFKKLMIVMICFLPVTTMAWGVLGHRIVGEIADKYLTSSAKKQIKNILGNESVAMSSNWMDFIKSDPTFGYLSNWHYINIKSGVTQNDFYAKLEADTATDIFTRINFVSNELRNRMLDPVVKERYLKILIHLVGDVHQPMHVGRPDDLGGNKIRLTWFNENVNLHQVWDERLINFQQLSYTEYANNINYITKKERIAWQKEPVKQWLWESYQIAEDIYNNTKSDDKIGYTYNFKYISVVNERLLKGGIHLAGLLNTIFK